MEDLLKCQISPLVKYRQNQIMQEICLVLVLKLLGTYRRLPELSSYINCCKENAY